MKGIKLVIVLALIVGAIFLLEGRKVGPSESENAGGSVITKEYNEEERLDIIEKKEKEFDRAHEITTPDGFVNTDDITIEELIGEKVILVDFWTYSCINCQRTLPYLNSWHEKYADDGLVILGLHTPEFEFEKDYDNVSRAVEKWSVKYPVILDNDFSTWQSYENRYWPRKYLIDIDGFIVYDHIGEGAYDETEAKIVELLNERSEVLGARAVVLDENQPDAPAIGDVRTPETYMGYLRLEYLANLPGQECGDRDCDYVAGDTENFAPNTFLLDGKWNIGPEASKLTGNTGSIFIRFFADKVNLVAGSDKPVKAKLFIDGEEISIERSGEHVTDGVVTFQEHDLYNLVDLQGNEYLHILEIRFEEPGVESFAFTFG